MYDNSIRGGTVFSYPNQNKKLEIFLSIKHFLCLVLETQKE